MIEIDDADIRRIVQIISERPDAAQLAERQGDGFGDRLIDCQVAGVPIRVVRDRGQWTILFQIPGIAHWYDVHLWAVLNESCPLDAPLSAREEADCATRAIEALSRFEVEPARLIEQLDRVGRARATHIFGND
ncbi:MAG: hypothetical protein AAFR38_09635 [Planctomycetota bacterium]